MAYNLRSRRIRDELLDEIQVEEQSESESEQRDDDDDYSGSSSDDEVEGDIDMEDASFNQRLLQSRARGRPCTKLKGKDGFTWDTRCPSRLSGV